MSTCTARRHGTASAYGNYGCRCDTARVAKTRQQKVYELRFTLRGERSLRDATGTRRRLEALHALGWRTSDLAPLLDATPSAVAKFRGSTQVQHHTAVAVAALYDQLADHSGPSAVTARRAARHGWLVPLWWDDETIDDPTYDPIANSQDPTPRQLVLEAVADLTARGRSARQIAEHLGVAQRSVVRYRRELAS